jgi:hypothetical protein
LPRGCAIVGKAGYVDVAGEGDVMIVMNELLVMFVILKLVVCIIRGDFSCGKYIVLVYVQICDIQKFSQKMAYMEEVCSP